MEQSCSTVKWIFDAEVQSTEFIQMDEFSLNFCFSIWNLLHYWKWNRLKRQTSWEVFRLSDFFQISFQKESIDSRCHEISTGAKKLRNCLAKFTTVWLNLTFHSNRRKNVKKFFRDVHQPPNEAILNWGLFSKDVESLSIFLFPVKFLALAFRTQRLFLENTSIGMTGYFLNCETLVKKLF